ncbi:MAG: NADH-quinone oxidoreductase subunit NuoH [Gemmatimonadaceae bacterium]
MLTPMFLLQVADPQLPPPSTLVFMGMTLAKIVGVFTVYMGGVAYLTLAERKISAWIQDRLGPNRVWKGWGQPAADGLKNLMKEESEPGGVNKPLFGIAPILAFVPALVTWAVIPFASPLPTPWGRMDMVVADLPVGFLYTLAISSLGVYGIVLAGWASNNKYALLGGLRSSAQMISYEIAMGMSTIPVLLLAGNVTLSAIIAEQSAVGWNVLTLSVAWFMFTVSAFAETNRLPFDLPEAESELIAGYHSEYSSMKFSFFFIAEYANMVTASALMTTLYWGGYDIPFTRWDNAPPFTVLKTLATLAAFAVKLVFFLFLYMWIRWTLPRFRYDQLMALGWKVMLPIALTYIVVAAAAILALDAAGVPRDFRFGLAMFALNAVLMGALFLLFDRGRLLSPASARVRDLELARMRSAAVRRSTPREESH